jgi:serine/threonine-protein kinase RsbW
VKSVNVIIESDRSEILKIEKLLSKLNEEFDLEMEKFVNFQIAVSEALINAIVHGNQEDKNKKVFCDLQYAGKQMKVKIRDEGEGFDFNKVPDPTSDENILKEHGRGIFIIRSLVDDCKCIASDKGTEIILTVNK